MKEDEEKGEGEGSCQASGDNITVIYVCAVII